MLCRREKLPKLHNGKRWGHVGTSQRLHFSQLPLTCFRMFILKSLKGHRRRVQHSTSRSFAGFRLVMNFSWINKFLMENFSSRLLVWNVGRSVLTSTLEFQLVFRKQLLWVISVISKSNNPETCGSLWSQLQLIYYLVVLISHSSYFHFVWFKHKYD